MARSSPSAHTGPDRRATDRRKRCTRWDSTVPWAGWPRSSRHATARNGMALGAGSQRLLPAATVRDSLRAQVSAIEPLVRVPARLKALKRRRKWQRAGKLVLAASMLLALLAGYDFWGFHRATAFEREPENPAPWWREPGPACWLNTLCCRYSGPHWHGRHDSEGANGP